MAEEDDTIATITEMLQYRARADKDRQTHRFYDRHGFVSQLAPPEIYSMAGKFAHLLRDWGFQKGEVIANGIPNSRERIICDFGIVMAGCVQANCQVIEKDGSDFWNTARISHCSGVIISARQDNSPNKILSQFYRTDNETTTTPSPPSTPTTAPNSSTNFIHDVTIPQAPTIRKVIVCDRTSLVTTTTTAATPEDSQNEVNESVKSGEHQKKEESLEQQLHQNQNKHQYPSLLETLKSLDDVKEFYQAECDPSDLAVLLSTSGTSGFNKLVPRTHKDILDYARSMGKQGRPMLIFNDRPLGWLGGYPFDYLGSGGCRVLQDEFDNQQTQAPRELWDIVSSAKCQGASFMPNEIIRLVNEFEHNPPEHKLMFISTGGQATRKELSKVMGLLCHCLVLCYGFSEGGVFTIEIIVANEETPAPEVEDFYCGKIYKDDITIKVVDADGASVEPGEVGEIYVKCDRIIKSYYNREDSVRHHSPPKLHTDDGWYMTGDRGKLLADGKLYCYGRIGDVASVNGVIIYLSWLESILNKFPEVQNSSVVAINDDVDNKNGGAGDVLFYGFVELKLKLKPDDERNNTTEEKEEEMKDFFVEQLVDTGYKNKLRLSHVFIVDRLPLTLTGKVNKRALKDMAMKKIIA